MLKSTVNTFLTVGANRSFSQAAKVLFMSNVSVMKHIDSLESSLGFKLLNRSKRGVTLTPAGASYFESMNRIQKEIEKAEEKARSIAASQTNVIRIGTSVLRLCQAFLPLWSLIEEDLNYEIEIIPFDDRELQKGNAMNFFTNIADCFVGTYPTTKASLLPLGVCECNIAVPLRHRLASHKTLTWEDLKGEKLALVMPGVGTQVNDRMFFKAKLHKEIEVKAIDHVYGLDDFNVALQENWLLEIPSLWSEIHPLFCIKPMEWDFQLPYGLVYASNPSIRVKGFIDALAASLSSS